MEVFALKAPEPLDSKLETGGDEPDVRSLPQRVVHDRLVLVNRDGTSRVDDVTPRLRVGRNRVKRAKEELFLEVGKELEVSFALALRSARSHQTTGLPGSRRERAVAIRRSAHLVDLDARILADDTGTRARRIEQHPVETSNDLGELPRIVVAHHHVLAAHTVDIGGQALCSCLVRVVGEDDAGVLEKSGDVCRLSTGGGSHVEDALVGLRRKGNDGEERRSGLEHVVTCKIFRSGTDRDGGLEHLQTDFAPLANRLEVDSAVHERLSEIPPAGP
jgi:hypothetical protein